MAKSHPLFPSRAHVAFLVGLCCLALGSIPARAERLVFFPLGKKLTYRNAKLVHMFDTRESSNTRTTLFAAISPAIELAVSKDHEFLGSSATAVDVSYNVTDPLVDYGPGVAFGIRDLSNETSEGRYLFTAMTFVLGQSGVWNGDSPAEGSFVLKYGKRGVKLGLAGYMPITNFLAVIAEIDEERSIAGIELKAIRDVEVRWLHRPRTKLLSVSLRTRF